MCRIKDFIKNCADCQHSEVQVTNDSVERVVVHGTFDCIYWCKKAKDATCGHERMHGDCGVNGKFFKSKLAT